MNTSKFNRAIHDGGHYYLMLSYEFLLDSRLSYDESAIMKLILQNDDSYVLNTTYLRKQIKMGAKKFYRVIKNLQKYGYLEKQSHQGSTHWIINEISTTSRLTTTQKTPLINTTISILNNID